MQVSSLLDTDLYKLTMMQVVFHHFPKARARYQFYCRSPDVSFRSAFPAIDEGIRSLSGLRLTAAELDYLRSLPWFREDFLTWLKDFQPDPEKVSYRLKGEQLTLSASGSWLETILLEIPLLAIISEGLVREIPDYQARLEQELTHKIQYLAGVPGDFRFTDFGTRRRASSGWHEKVLRTLISQRPENLAGTSNVLMAFRLGLSPLGTMAHEYLQACQVLSGNLEGSQGFALRLWKEEYGNHLSIALTDVISLQAFLKEFNPDLARHYQGVRHDSGDPFEFGEKMLEFYHSLGINPLEKTLVFSDGLDFKKALKIRECFHERVQVAFGIGTFLTHDPGFRPANIVIKLTHCNNHPVAKLSDSPGKIVCEDQGYLKEVLEFKNRCEENS